MVGAFRSWKSQNGYFEQIRAGPKIGSSGLSNGHMLNNLAPEDKRFRGFAWRAAASYTTYAQSHGPSTKRGSAILGCTLVALHPPDKSYQSSRAKTVMRIAPWIPSLINGYSSRA